MRAICNQPAADDGCLRGSFGELAQLDFGLSAIKRIGYDLDGGGLIRPCIPALGFRRVFELPPVFTRPMLGRRYISTLHEAGHALYEQGVDPAGRHPTGTRSVHRRA